MPRPVDLLLQNDLPAQSARRAGTVRAAMVALALAAQTPAIAAGALQISPVIVNFPSAAGSASVNITNQDAKATSVQVRVFRWTQADGEESLTPTQDIVASPPIAAVAPGATLTIRIIRSAAKTSPVEDAYRLVIDQLPSSDNTGRAQVSMLLRQVLPVFVGNPDAAKPEIAWRLARTPHGTVLRASNSGDRHIRIAKIVLESPGHRPVAMGGGLLGYVLGRSEMSWPVPDRSLSPAGGATVTVRGSADIGAINATALVAKSQ